MNDNVVILKATKKIDVEKADEIILDEVSYARVRKHIREAKFKSNQGIKYLMNRKFPNVKRIIK